MNNATTFPINDAHAFAVLLKVVAASNPLKGLWSLPFRDKLSFAWMAALGAIQKRHSVRPFQQMRYWSTVPYRHGPDDAVKYSAIPSAGNPACRPARRSELSAGRTRPTSERRLADELFRYRAAVSRHGDADLLGSPSPCQFLDRKRERRVERNPGASFTSSDG